MLVGRKCKLTIYRNFMRYQSGFYASFEKSFRQPRSQRATTTDTDGSAPTPTHDAMGVDGDASTMGDDGDAGDLRDVRLHARQPFHLRLDVAFGLVHALTCGIAYGPLGAMDGEGAFERVFVVGLGAIAHALVALSTHWSVRHPRRIHVTLIAHTRSSLRSLGAHFRRLPNLFDDTTDLLRPPSPPLNRSPPRLRSRAGRSRRMRQSAWLRPAPPPARSRSSTPPTAVESSVLSKCPSPLPQATRSRTRTRTVHTTGPQRSCRSSTGAACTAAMNAPAPSNPRRTPTADQWPGTYQGLGTTDKAPSRLDTSGVQTTFASIARGSGT